VAEGESADSAPGTPLALHVPFDEIAAALAADGWPLAANAPLTLEAGAEGEEIGRWVYALVGPFATVADGISAADLPALWAGEREPLFLAPETAAVFGRLWGPPGPSVTILPADNIAERLWQRDVPLGSRRAIVPFGALQPELKVLTIDHQSPLRGDLDVTTWPLALPLTLSGPPDQRAQWRTAYPQPLTNWQVERMTRVALTGVTALVRAVAYNMELNGILWPGEEVRGVLRSADIAHLSNEVAFVQGCPPPNPVGGTTFCSDPRYFELFLDLGIDVVELTGNHVNDYGANHLAWSIDLYEEAGMQWFGGGRNAADAQTAALFEHNGNRIAFVGCNPVGPPFAWATETGAGSRPCDGMMEAQIGRLQAAGTLVIATLQYNEYYQYRPPADQQAAFRALAQAGATVVSGSQAHHAQGFGFHAGGWIHYGPGNLFFDQMDWLGTRQALVDLLTIYDGRLVGVELWTGLIEQYARPRLMTPAERQNLLETLFANSDW
jgi:poly-gamma-glutamate synthesis protein (capsule biosynthesis protein)